MTHVSACARARARPGMAIGNVEGLYASSHGLGKRELDRSV